MYVYSEGVADHRVQAALVLVVIDDSSTEPPILSNPNLLLEAAVTPRDQSEPRVFAVHRHITCPIWQKGRARSGGIGEMEGAADAGAIDRNSEAGGGVDEGEGEGAAAEVEEGGGGMEQDGEKGQKEEGRGGSEGGEAATGPGAGHLGTDLTRC